MKTLVIYDVNTGQITQTTRPAPVGKIPPGLVPDGFSAIRTSKNVSGKTHHVRAGKLVAKPARDKAAESIALAWTELRIRRANILSRDLDTINAVRWDAMSEPERRAWRDYRQALLDLPQNTVDPRNPTWPKKPE